MPRISYFAYGSNMCAPRLRARVPSATFRATGFLQGHVLRFHKLGVDGSGKCDAYATDRARHRLWGVVFDLDVTQQPDLDRAEWLGVGYERRNAIVNTTDGTRLPVFSYHALTHAIDVQIQPYRWYKEFVIAGAREHGLPESYVATIQQVHSWEDPDPERAAKHRLLLPAGYRARLTASQRLEE